MTQNPPSVMCAHTYTYFVHKEKCMRASHAARPIFVVRSVQGQGWRTHVAESRHAPCTIHPHVVQSTKTHRMHVQFTDLTQHIHMYVHTLTHTLEHALYIMIMCWFVDGGASFAAHTRSGETVGVHCTTCLENQENTHRHTHICPPQTFTHQTKY